MPSFNTTRLVSATLPTMPSQPHYLSHFMLTYRIFAWPCVRSFHMTRCFDNYVLCYFTLLYHIFLRTNDNGYDPYTMALQSHNRLHKQPWGTLSLVAFALV